MEERALISVVIPCCNEEGNVPRLHQALVGVFAPLASRYTAEFLFIDDGSTDGTAAAIETLAKNDSRVTLISFSRNFGKEVATTAGIRNAKGAAVIMLDADLQHPPELIQYGEYENYFDNNPDYTLMENNDYFDLYKNNIKTTELLADNSFFKRINSTEYKVYLENLTTAQALILFQNYNSNWSLFINKNNASNDSCAMVNEYNDGNIKTTECAPEQRFFDGEEFSYLYQKPIFDNTHQLVDDYANGWTIDPNYIKQNFDPSYYKVNPDGSIDIELTIYFKPQSYFDLGLIVSGATVLACFGYLGWDFARRRKEKMTATTTIKKEEDV
jgi:glycosyltransferase involved in cell wall biosynthesis